MGTCTSTPRLHPTLRGFMASRPADALGEEWYFDTMNLLLDRWGPSHVQFLRKKFLEATGDGEEELDKMGFFRLFAELQDMPSSVSESAFRMFDADGSGKLNFKEFCCALALCCQLMSSEDEKIRFVFDMFDTNDDGLLSTSEVRQLVEALREEKSTDEAIRQAGHRSSRRISEVKQELLGNSQPLSFDRFYQWASKNMDSLDDLLCTFQLVPAPQRERSVCEEILSRHSSLREGTTWYCISHKWLQVWKAYTGWTSHLGRRVEKHGHLPDGRGDRSERSERDRARERCHSGDSGVVSLPLFELGNDRNYQSLPARPPEIDNSDLEGEHKGELKMNLVEHLDFELIPEELWLQLVEWYGGGPALPRKVICMGHDHQMQVELYPALVLVVVAGADGQPLPQFSRRFFLSKQSTLEQTLSMLSEKLQKPADRSRLWHRSKGEQWRLVQNPLMSIDEFLEGKGWDAGAFLLETSEDSTWPRDRRDAAEAEEVPAVEADLRFEVGDRVEAKGGTGQWLRGTIVDVVLRSGSTPSQVKVHFDSTVYKSDEWIHTSSQRLATLGSHTGKAEGDKTEETSGVPGATGLTNLGNTCFMNATLQCMVNTPLVREYFLSSQHLRDISERRGSSSKGRLAQEFGHVLLELWSGKSAVVSPRNLKRAIDQFAPQFAGYEQHDAQEFLDFILEGLHDDLNRGIVSGGATSRSASKSRRREQTPKLFSAKPLLTRGGRDVTPRRVKAVWREREEDNGSLMSGDEARDAEVQSTEVVPIAETSWGLRGGQESWTGFLRGEEAKSSPEESVPAAEHEVGDEAHLTMPEGLRVGRDGIGEASKEREQEPSSPASPAASQDPWLEHDQESVIGVVVREDLADAQRRHPLCLQAPAPKAKAEPKRSSRWWSFAWHGHTLEVPKEQEKEVEVVEPAPAREEEISAPDSPGAQVEKQSSQSSAQGAVGRKTPSGSGAAVVAARRGEESGSCEEGVQESEDFVPELLTPVPRRSRSLFGWRRREAAQAQEEQPGTPRRRSKTPGTMTTLREESEGERRGREGTAQEERGRSYLPWRGPVRRENSAEGLEEGPARREGRPKDKDASILPAFLRRATSKDNRSRTQRTAPHAGDSPATDGLAASPMSEAQGSGVCSPSEDASTKTASSSMPFTFFRAPWSGKRESSVPSRSEPGGEREGEITPVVLPGTAEGDARDPVSPQQSDAVHEDIQEETEVDEDKLTDEEKAALTWERYRAQNRSLVGDVFEGQLRSQLRCCCGHNSSTFEPFRYLSVPIPANHSDSFELKVVFFPALSSERPALSRFSVSVPKSSSAKRLQLSLARRLPVSLSAVLLAEVYRSRIHRYLDPNLPLSDVRAEDQLFAFEVPQNTQDLCEYQQRLLSDKTLEDSKGAQVLMIQAMHRRVVDVCRSDGHTWAQKREVFGLPFVMSAASTWSYATLHEMLMLHAARFLTPGQASWEGQVPFVARIVNASGTACGACDRRNCTGCLLPKGTARLRLRAGLFTGAPTAKIYLALDWVDSSMYDQGYVDAIRDEDQAEATAEEAATDAEASKLVPLNACVDAFAEAEEMKVENGNGVKCDKCKVAVDAQKKIDIWREPDVLVLHIKRFHFSGEHFEKISTPVQVPLKDLDVRAWVVGPTGGAGTAYDLYGIACHRGGMSGGHYTSYCMNEGGKEPQWLKFNDDSVSTVDIQKELPEISKQCYVLFYRKRAFSSSNMINYLSL